MTPALSSGEAPKRAHPQHLYQLITAPGLRGNFSQQDWMRRLAARSLKGEENTFSRTRLQGIDSVMTVRFHNMRNTVDCPAFLSLSLPSFLFSAQLFPYSLCALWRALTIPPSNPIEKAPKKKNREMRAANPFFIPLVALNKRRMCCLSVTEGIKSSELSHAFNAPCKASLRETEWRGLQQQQQQ